MTPEELIDLWISAEEDLREENYTSCDEKKALFNKKFNKLTSEQKEEVENYLSSIGA